MPEPTPNALRVLVVDDNRDAAESLAVLLELSGYRVLTAADGYSGLSAAKEFKPDVILLDIGLPGMNGYAVAKALRQDPNSHHVRVIAISGYCGEEERERSRQAGFDLYLVKPVDPELLQGLLQERTPLSPCR